MAIYFNARRLGHANLYTLDYRRGFTFYNEVIGYEEAYVQPGKKAIFLSNGNTYHDLALMEGMPSDKVLQRRAGLNHIAFELETEKDLVSGWEKAVKAGYKFDATINHDAAHSVYIKDPEGNVVELYADVVKDWRATRTGVITKKKPSWVPGISTTPLAMPLYPKDPEIRDVRESLFRARKVTHVTLIVHDLDKQIEFYKDFVGLKPVVTGIGGSWVALGGYAAPQWDIVLIRAREGSEENIGLHHVGIEVHSSEGLRRVKHGHADLMIKWSEAKYRSIEGFREVVCLLDPGSIGLQLYFNYDDQSSQLKKLSREDALFMM